jgi:CheY-like chemotaxis protein
MRNKILIVDDDMDSLNMQQTICQNVGFYTQTAINGLDAMKYIKQDRPDLILMDIFMPQMDGYDAITYIKKNFYIPIIVVTAGGNACIKKIKEIGIHFYVQKPIVAQKLQKEISKCIKHHYGDKEV